MKKHRRVLVVRRIQGHSMVPVLPPGTTVVGIWPGRVLAGDIVIFHHDGREKVKRIQEVLGDGSLFMVGDHPETSVDSRHFGAVEPTAVIARIVWPKISRPENV